MLQDLGHADAATFIQSGNAVFSCDGDPLPAIAHGLKTRFGIGSTLFLYDLDSYRGILDANPYAEAGRADGARVHVFFLQRPAPEMDLAGALALAEGEEALTLTDRALYFNAPNGIGRSVMAQKLPRFLKAANTARNQRTAEAILTLAESLPCAC